MLLSYSLLTKRILMLLFTTDYTFVNVIIIFTIDYKYVNVIIFTIDYKYGNYYHIHY